MKSLPIVVAAVAMQCIRLCADTIYYETATGENFRNQSWHAMNRREFEANQPHDVVDFYTFERLADGSSRVRRQTDSMAGDRLLLATYHYAPNGCLTKIDWEFRTFNGMTSNMKTKD
jgi:hypothetical protein